MFRKPVSYQRKPGKTEQVQSKETFHNVFTVKYILILILLVLQIRWWAQLEQLDHPDQAPQAKIYQERNEYSPLLCL